MSDGAPSWVYMNKIKKLEAELASVGRGDLRTLQGEITNLKKRIKELEAENAQLRKRAENRGA